VAGAGGTGGAEMKKKSAKTPKDDLETARKRLKEVMGR
jgi:phage-related protein